jgi:hypothetical protein
MSEIKYSIPYEEFSLDNGLALFIQKITVSFSGTNLCYKVVCKMKILIKGLCTFV